MSLKKMDTAASFTENFSPSHEAAWLMHKHVGGLFDQAVGQVTFGKRRTSDKAPKLTEEDVEHYWAQMVENGGDRKVLTGGHGVPLSSEAMCFAALT